MEERTKKLYEVCNFRKVPIFTFINKCDREGKVPLELIDEIENTLKMKCYPVNWPLGVGGLFRGVYNRIEKRVYLFNKDTEEETIIDVDSLSDPRWAEWIHQDVLDMVLEEIELIELDNDEFSREEFLKGNLSPAFWGSAKLNFGVDQFLNYFTKWAPGPSTVKTVESEVNPMDNFFSGFIFKIQANMDRKHRDRMAFMRICSGKFERGMKVKHMRLGRDIRLSHSAQFLAKDRETVEAAYAGDIVGVSDPGLFRIGDSVTSGKKITFEKIPQFSPELFTKLHVSDAMKRQKLQKAIQELSEEGVIQLFIDPVIGAQDPIVGVVGELQFEVLKHRLEDEYNLETRLDRAPYTVARWPRNKDGSSANEINGVTSVFRDKDDRPVVLLSSVWDINWLQKENEDVIFGSPFAESVDHWM